MPASLQLGPWDLCDPSSKVRVTDGVDFGAGAPILSSVASSALDGSAVTGLATGNRQITLPILIEGGNQLAVVGLMNQLLLYVDQQAWQFQWTPAGGLPVVANNYRATVTVTDGDVTHNSRVFRRLTVAFDSLPFFQSPVDTVISLGGTGSAGTPTTLDDFGTTAPTGSTPIGGATITTSLVTSPVVSSPKACKVVYTGSGPTVDMSVAKTGLSISLADGGRAVTVATRRVTGNTVFSYYLTLVTSAGTFTTYLSNGAMGAGGVWKTLTFDMGTYLPAGTTVTGYTLELIGPFASGTFYLDDLTFQPSATGSSSGGGRTVNLTGVPGTARTPGAVHLTPVAGGAATFRSWIIHAPPPNDLLAQIRIPSGSPYTTDPSVVFNGRYAVWVTATTLTSAGTARTFGVTIQQSPMPGTPGGVTVTSPSYTPSSAQVANQTLWYVGDLTLPLYQSADEVPTVYLVTVGSSHAGDVLSASIWLNTQGQTLLSPGEPSADCVHVWTDRPDPLTELGRVVGGANADRSDAVALTQYLPAARSLLVNPGNSTLFVFSGETDLTGEITFAPQWAQDADQ